MTLISQILDLAMENALVALVSDLLLVIDGYKVSMLLLLYLLAAFHSHSYLSHGLVDISETPRRTEWRVF